MEKFFTPLTVDDVYSLAAGIGKEFEAIIDTYGVDVVTKLMPKVIRVLEYLEAYALRTDTAEDEVVDLKAQIAQLEFDKLEKAEFRHKFEKELEQIEDAWRKEMSDLSELVSRLQEENHRLSSSLKEKENFLSHRCQGCLSDEDILMLHRLKQAVDKQTNQLHLYEKELHQKNTDLDALQQQLERSNQLNYDHHRRNKHLQSQMRQLVDERADLQGQLQDQQREFQVLRQRLGVAVKDNFDLAKAHSAVSVDLSGKLVIDLEDPNRPRFTLDELKHILFERNELKARVSDLEDELALYRPRPAPSLEVVPADDDDLPVQGPINQEPAEKLFSPGKASGIRKFFPTTLWPRLKTL